MLMQGMGSINGWFLFPFCTGLLKVQEHSFHKFKGGANGKSRSPIVGKVGVYVIKQHNFALGSWRSSMASLTQGKKCSHN